WNLNVGERRDQISMRGEFDEITESALSSTPLEGLPLELCDAAGSLPTPQLSGPTLAQAAWRGCHPPPALRTGLSEQIVEVIRCAAPDRLVALPLGGGAGMVQVTGESILEYLEQESLNALLEVSRDLNAPIRLSEAFVDPAQLFFLRSAEGNLSCPGATPALGVAGSLSGQEIELSEVANAPLSAALEARGFLDQGAGRRWRSTRGSDLSTLAIFAFQALWNENRSGEPIPLSGTLDVATEQALERAPIGGFPTQPCAGLPAPPEPPPAPRRCVVGCFNQDCPGRYDFCDEAWGECAPISCEVDQDCLGLERCDDPSRGSRAQFYCDQGQCRRGSAS
ncbi:MAG: hypothetical protein VYD19_11410, partial [Myxococcota bacterium]|nr:hypothetical protein [Myxococcota bacterium]